MRKTLIQGVSVYDGTGAPPETLDVLVIDDRIAAIEPKIGVADATTISGRGRALAPGFIDMHSHADFTLPAYPDATNSISQGVTTEVLGNCGWSPAPLSDDEEGHRKSWTEMGAALGPDLEWAWSSFKGFLETLDRARPSVNCVALVGHSALRAATFGIEDRAPSREELGNMLGLLDEALDAGAWGLSTGLVYPPSSFAEADEVRALAARVASGGGLYSTHMRDEGTQLDAAIDEAVAIAETTGARVEISHLKAAGPANHGRISSALEKIDRARSDGLSVGCDVYPYLAGSTVLTQLLPSWAVAGGVDELMGRLNSSETRDRIRAEVSGDRNAYLNKVGGWNSVMVAGVENSSLKHFEGRYFPAIAHEQGIDEYELLFDTVVADRAQTTMILFMMDRSDMELVLDHGSAVVGSDQLGVTGPEARVHPRSYGTFAKVIQRGVSMDERALADVIERSTGRTARRVGLNQRGFIRPGFIADLVLFTPSEVAARASYEQPTLTASGVDFVFVGGEPAVAEGNVVNLSLGAVLRPE